MVVKRTYIGMTGSSSRVNTRVIPPRSSASQCPDLADERMLPRPTKIEFQAGQ
jgi:hypothetical protein